MTNNFRITARGIHLVSRQRLIESKWHLPVKPRTVLVDGAEVVIGSPCPSCGCKVRGSDHANGNHHKGTIPLHKKK